MNQLKTDYLLDAKGLACPMPIVKTKKTMKELDAGQVVEVQATDQGSTADMEAWANSSGHQYLGTIEEEDVLKHYIRKSSDEDTTETKYPHTASNEDVKAKLSNNEQMIVLDVRESAEYAFGHIPNAVSIPLGELDERADELNKDDNIYVVCRTGSRSDLASQKLAEKGFQNVVNVVPGMSEWSGDTEKLNN
ncbi:SirA family protein [Gracilibacillus halophilus YIM-C55.5]|uniref:SirA family protein n=1 Tax=Gracilibacillus halophilus YIM-C55.5 TaxID=1308866 RepID=N4WX91_9BACI|nr:sulfurtransferase TusA family protein [Gracilibacillus halophilus]ENH97696.1 SirA family protein [Gracilibacillus halophilus YIM-C55.5]